MLQGQESIEKRLQVGVPERLKLSRLLQWVHWIYLGGNGLVFMLAILVFAAFKDVPVWGDWVPANESISPNTQRAFIRKAFSEPE